MKSKLLSCIFLASILLCSIFISGCVPVITSTVAYDYACSHQEHGAYTDYYFNAVGDNLRREKQGLAPNAIIPEKEWVAGYQLRLEYTEYYHDALADIAKTNNQPGLAFKTIPPFDEWKTNEYIQMMEDRARLQQRGHKPAPTR